MSIRINESYDGQEVGLAVGEVLAITLAENQTTGFRWAMKIKPESSCMFVKDNFEGMARPPGKGGSHRWYFRAVHPGTEVIELEYRRPWEKSSQPARTFTLNVRVR